MALGAVLGAALQSPGTRARALWMGGVDVLKQTGGAATYGVTVESIEVTESGPGAVSTMVYEIDDPQLSIGITDGMDVTYYDIANGRPVFVGWIDHYSIRPAFGQQGRTISVSAVGVESILDWSINLGTYGINVGSRVSDGVQLIASRATGTGELRAGSAAGAGFTNSTQDLPVTATSSNPGFLVSETISIAAGTTMREALRQLSSVSPVPQNASVDFYRGLRTWNVGSPPADYLGLFIDDSPAGAIVAEDIDHEVDSALVRGVYVVGTGVTLYLSDGTGKPGPTVRLEDANITTVAGAQYAAAFYLAERAAGVRGSLSLFDRAEPTGVRAGSLVTITDARIGLSPGVYAISQIRWTYTGARSNMAFTYGALPASAARLIRNLTRKTLS